MVTIVGAGMAGLLAGAMLRREASVIIEKQKGLPNNHHSLLRFRSPIVGETLGIPFRKVSVMKAMAPWRNPVADALSYSRKSNMTYHLRSSTTARGEIDERWVSPGDLIARMADSVMCPIELGKAWDGPSGGPTISTLPMPYLMGILGYNSRMDFAFINGMTLSARLYNADAFATVYIPHQDFFFNRISLMGNELIMEGTDGRGPSERIAAMYDQPALAAEYAAAGAEHLGIIASDIDPRSIQVHEQRYAKILPINDVERKRFILWASQEHNVYSLGRFATWRPGLLMDDIVNDVRVIQKLINGGSSYDHQK